MKLWVAVLDFYTSFLDNEKARAGVIKGYGEGFLLGSGKMLFNHTNCELTS